ncbi:10282_t:CDS:2, partial [Cetraspora pellucida]
CMTATKIVKELERLIEKNKITHKKVPSIKRVKNWIAVYAAGLKQKAAAERCINSEIMQDSNNSTIQIHNDRETCQSYSKKLGHRCREDFIPSNDHKNLEYQSNVTTKKLMYDLVLTVLL